MHAGANHLLRDLPDPMSNKLQSEETISTGPPGTTSQSRRRLVRARGVELGLALSGAKTPVLLVHGLAIVTDTVGLPRLIVGFEVEQVHVPGEHAADGGLPVGLGVGGTSLGGVVVGTAI